MAHGKEAACSAVHPGVVDPGSISGLGRSPGGNGNPPQYIFPGEPNGQRSLVRYGPWGRKELDTSEQLTHSFALYHCHYQNYH